jgi:hypothetical protein
MSFRKNFGHSEYKEVECTGLTLVCVNIRLGLVLTCHSCMQIELGV